MPTQGICRYIRRLGQFGALALLLLVGDVWAEDPAPVKPPKPDYVIEVSAMRRGGPFWQLQVTKEAMRATSI